MSIKYNFYCRTELYPTLDISLFPEFRKENCFLLRNESCKEYDMYAKDHDDFKSLAVCIDEIKKIWEDVDLTISKDNPSDIWCGSIVLYNQWGNFVNIGMYLDRYYLRFVSKNTVECRENLARSQNKEWKKIILFIPDWTQIDEFEFISQERSYSLIKEWLENNTWNVDFDDDDDFW